MREEPTSDQQVMSYISADHLEVVKQDFLSYGGALTIEQFVRSMLRSVDTGEPSTKEPQARKSVRVAAPEDLARSVGGSLDEDSASKAPQTTTYAAAVMDLFSQVDVHGEGIVTWDDVSNYLAEQGMSGGDQFTVDSIKTYESSSATDLTKHESPVEKIMYFEQIDVLMCLSRRSRGFRLYDPKRCTIRAQVGSAHRGAVINACHLEAQGQIATCGSDMSICMWDQGNLGLRNRIATRDVQLCLQWDPMSGHLFSGSIDGTLSCWDLQNMCLADSQRGKAKGSINDLLVVRDLNLMASASSDGGVLMWDTATMRPKRTFKGHKKGTFSLAYSMDYRCLLTAGLEQEALVWNPYVERVPIFRLKGHTHALCGVAVVPGTPQILSADVKGTFRLWDMRNFRCVQSFGSQGGQYDSRQCELNAFCATPPHRRIAAGGSRVIMYDYMDEWGGEDVTDIGGITDALYNPHAGEFYTVSTRSVKAWSAGTGSLYKVLRDISENEITAASIADNGRKLYIGDAGGRVTAHSLKSGALLKEFERHSTDISCLRLWDGTPKFFSASWDGVIKVHHDEGQRPQTKAEFRHHRDGVTCLEVSPDLMLLATGGTDTQVCIYDLKTLKLERCITKQQHVIAGLSFLPTRCVLAVADQGGYITLWRMPPHPGLWERLHVFQNAPLLDLYLDGPTWATTAPPVDEEQRGPPVPLSGLTFAPPQSAGVPQPLLYTADAKGGLRCWDLSMLCQRRGIGECSLQELFDGRCFSGSPSQLALNGAGGASTPALLSQQGGGGGGGRTALATPVGSSSGELHTGASSPAASRRGGEERGPSAVGFGGGAFLTTPTEADVFGPTGATLGGKVRFPSVQPPLPSSTEPPSLSGAGGLGGGPQLVRLLAEAEGHDEAVLSLTLTQRPSCLLTCGKDRRVRLWGIGKLDHLGTLLQRKDGSYHFPYDSTAVQEIKLSEANDLLLRMGPLSPRSAPAALTNGPPLAALATTSPGTSALPPIALTAGSSLASAGALSLSLPTSVGARGAGPLSARTTHDMLVSLGPSSGRRRPKPKADPNEAWRAAAEAVLTDPNAVEEDFQMLFEQMSRLGATGGPATGSTARAAASLDEWEPQQMATERLCRDAGLRSAVWTQHRSKALSQEESKAADRLAEAMAALGADTFGTYAGMAKALRPKVLGPGGRPLIAPLSAR